MHIISGQLLGILFPIFSYSHSMNRKCGHFHVVSYFIRKTNVAIHGDTQRHKSETKLL